MSAHPGPHKYKAVQFGEDGCVYGIRRCQWCPAAYLHHKRRPAGKGDITICTWHKNAKCMNHGWIEVGDKVKMKSGRSIYYRVNKILPATTLRDAYIMHHYDLIALDGLNAGYHRRATAMQLDVVS